MTNTLHIECQISRKQASAIARIIEEHNDSLFNGNDYLDPDFITGADCTYIEGEEDSVALVNVFRQVQYVLSKDWIRENEFSAQDIINAIVDDGFEDMTNQDILDVLEDGEALAELGFTDDDQEAIEEAYDIVKKRLVNKVFILDDANEVIEMTEAEFIAEYASEVNTPIGIQKEHFWNPETGKMMFWQAGREKENFEYPLEYSKKEADAILFKFAKMDADRYGVSYFNDREEAEEIAALKEKL